MSMRLFVVTLATILAGSSVIEAKGPKDAKKHRKRGGYSGKGVSAFSQPITPSRRTAGIVGQSRKRSAQPPPSRAQGQEARRDRRAGGSTVVRFPNRQSVNRRKAVRESAALSAGSPSRQRPLVFYPKVEKREPATAVTIPSQPANRPAQSRPSEPDGRKRRRYSGLRPDDSANRERRGKRPSEVTIVNRPTVINNQTTNITNNVTNVNRWYRDNAWRNRVAINSRHWNGRPWWYRPDYGDWHHGHWHGRYYYRGRNAWSHIDSTDHAWLSGLVAWGLGNLIYRSGYQVYSNPYYSQPLLIGSTTINYSRPICVQKSEYEIAYADDEAKAQQLRDQALAYFNRARRAFQLGETARAYDEVNRAIALMPDDTALHEFRALVLFSVGRYREAAEVMHAVLAVAPGWDWTTLSGLYPNNDIYTGQLRRLEEYVRSNSRQADARFLLAYHYITIGYADHAERQLRTALILNPDDRLSADLLTLISKEEGDEERPAPADEGTIEAADLEGDWKALRLDGAIELELEGDEFQWDYDLPENDETLRGKYTVTQDLLLFATENGSQMVGTVRMTDRDHFTFRLLGSSETDPGLQFSRR